MKAFMSNRDDRIWTSLDNAGGTVFATENAVSAINEAHHIISQAEAPMPIGYMMAERCYRGLVLIELPIEQEIYGALAEALAAFVEG